MQALLQKYNACLLRQPLLTKTLTTSGLMVAGDVTCQGISYSQHGSTTLKFWSEYFDARRTTNMAIVGLFLGPWLHVWYNQLHRLMPAPAPVVGKAVDWAHIAKLTVVDQAVNGPLICFGFFTGLGLLEGQSWDQISSTLHDNYAKTVLLNWCWWGGAMAANFRFLSPQYRVLGVNCSALAWNTALSFIRFEGGH